MPTNYAAADNVVDVFYMTLLSGDARERRLYPDAIPGEGVGPDGYGAGPVGPRPFANRGAATRYDDLYSSRPARTAARGHVGLQLFNGVSGFARSILAPPRNVVRTENVNRHVLPGDRAIVPASPSQIAQWMAQTTGQQPREVTGNGSVVAGAVWGTGGAF